jgi:hypothetical protein
LQAFPSVHDVLFGTAGFWQPVVALQLSVVHTFPSLQLGGVPAAQVPAWQVSAPLHTVLSGQAVPLATATFWHPVVGLQLSVVHTLLSLQLSGVPAVQVPPWHTSAPLHTVLSAHDVPFSTAVAVQPKLGEQPSVVHTLPSLQTSAVPVVHVPFWQVSAPLQRLPSGHAVPFATAVFAHPEAGLHESPVHTFPSLQLSAVPAVQVPFWQVSAPLQRLPSGQEVPLATGVTVHPVAGLHPSVVHTFPSLHVSGVPEVHAPAWQVSVPLQRLPSAHAVPFATVAFEHWPALQVSVVQGFPSLQSAFTTHD